MRDFAERLSANHRNLIAGLERGEAVSLFVHEAKEQLLFLRLSDNPEMCAVHVHRIILGP